MRIEKELEPKINKQSGRFECQLIGGNVKTIVLTSRRELRVASRCKWMISPIVSTKSLHENEEFAQERARRKFLKFAASETSMHQSVEYCLGMDKND